MKSGDKQGWDTLQSGHTTSAVPSVLSRTTRDHWALVGQDQYWEALAFLVLQVLICKSTINTLVQLTLS